MPVRVIVAGAVAWANRDAIRRELAPLGPKTIVIHGDSPGADALGGEVAAELGYTVVPMAKSSQDYARYKRAAWKGLNERMVAMGPELVLVFHPDIGKSKGSGHLRQLCDAAGIEVRVFAS